jgi:hypothetical protein
MRAWTRTDPRLRRCAVPEFWWEEAGASTRVNLDPGVDASTVVYETQSTVYWLPITPPDCTASLRARKTVCVVASDTYKDNDYHSNRHDDGVAVIVSVCGDVPISWGKR